MSIVTAIHTLAATTSRNEKEAILKANESDLLKQVLLYAYDPFKRYNISTKIESFVGVGASTLEEFSTTVFTVLDKLVKRELSGNAAVEVISSLTLVFDAANFELIKNIILKDLRCGISDSTINKVFKNLVPTFDVQLAAKPDRIDKMTYPAYVETKWDGMRCIVVYDGETVQYLSRGGKEITTLSYMDEEIKKFLKNPGVLDSEVMSDTFLDTISSVKRKTSKDQTAKLYIFDYIPFEDFSKGECKVKQSDRKTQLSAMWDYGTFEFLRPSVAKIVNSKEEAMQYATEVMATGAEGAIVKKMDAPYGFKRSDNWIKIKKQLDNMDLEVIDLEEGEGKYAGHLGAFVVDYNGVAVRVGTGLSDKDRATFWENKETIVGSFIEIAGMEETPDGSIRHPVFVKIRSYKGTKA